MTGIPQDVHLSLQVASAMAASTAQITQTVQGDLVRLAYREHARYAIVLERLAAAFDGPYMPSPATIERARGYVSQDTADAYLDRHYPGWRTDDYPTIYRWKD